MSKKIGKQKTVSLSSGELQGQNAAAMIGDGLGVGWDPLPKPYSDALERARLYAEQLAGGKYTFYSNGQVTYRGSGGLRGSIG